MTTNIVPETTNGVLYFVEDEDYEGPASTAVEVQAGAVERPQRPLSTTAMTPQPAENATIGAVRRADQASTGSDSNPVLTRDDDDDEEESTALAPWKPSIDIAQPTVSAPRAPAARTTKAVEQAGSAPTTAQKDKRKRNPAAPIYGRTSLRDPDFLTMVWLRKFGYSTSKQLGIVLNVKAATAHKRALGLRERGLIGSEGVLGMTQLWYLTSKGHEVLDFKHIDDERVVSRYTPGRGIPSKLEHNLAVIQVAAQLVGGSSPITAALGYPFSTGLELLPFLVPEQYMNSAFSKATFDKDGKIKPVDAAWTIQERAGSGRIDPSKVLRKHPELWTVVNHPLDRDSTKGNHPADLVIDFEHVRGDAGMPKSVAIEVEISVKQPSELKKIVNGFWQAKRRGAFPAFNEVVYVSNKESIKSAALKAAQSIVKDDAQVANFLTTVDLTDATGGIFSGKASTL